MSGVRALLFDVFGTLVDWRSSIAREARDLFGPRGIDLDGEAFADAWRARYEPAMEEVRRGRRPFTTLDELHRLNLDQVLRQFGHSALDEAARAHLNLAWHRLEAWPDVAPGLARLRAKFLVAPCSNGHISLQVDLARRNGLMWDAILGAEIARDYKPSAVVYLSSAAALGCLPAQTMMVAAHSRDLEAARASGLRTAFLARPDEYGPGRGEREPGFPVDVSAASMNELADRLKDARDI